MYKLKVLIEYDENFYGEQMYEFESFNEMYEFANKGSDKVKLSSEQFRVIAAYEELKLDVSDIVENKERICKQP